MSAGWMREAACLGVVADHEWFPTTTVSGVVLRICGGCPVRAECFEYAVADPDLVGVWGGTTWNERDRVRQERGLRRFTAPRQEQCRHCGKTFDAENGNRKYCSSSCRFARYEVTTRSARRTGAGRPRSPPP